MHLKDRFALLVGEPSKLLFEAGGHRGQIVDVLEAHRDLADFRAVDPQQLLGIVEVDGAIPAAGPGNAIKNTMHRKGLAVDRTVPVGGHQHHRVPHRDLHALGQQRRNQDAARNQQLLARFFLRDAGSKQRHGPEFVLRNHGVEADVGRFAEVAEHGPQPEAEGEGFHRRFGAENLLDLCQLFGVEVAIERQVVDGGHIALAVDLHMAHDRIGDLADHQAFEGAGHGDEKKNRHHAEGDQGRGQQGSPFVAQEVFGGDFYDVTHRFLRCRSVSARRLPR